MEIQYLDINSRALKNQVCHNGDFFMVRIKESGNKVLGVIRNGCVEVYKPGQSQPDPYKTRKLTFLQPLGSEKDYLNQIDPLEFQDKYEKAVFHCYDILRKQRVNVVFRKTKNGHEYILNNYKETRYHEKHLQFLSVTIEGGSSISSKHQS